MRINFNKFNPSFGLIKLNPSDRNKAENLLTDWNTQDLTQDKKEALSVQLYDVFEPYLEKEGKLKAKKSYVIEDVISDIKVLFWQLVSKLKGENILENIIKKIDEYKPHKSLLKPEYSSSLDAPIRDTKNSKEKKTLVETLTKEDLPKPLSALSDTEKEKIQTELETTLDSAALPIQIKERMAKRGEGSTYREIASDEKITRSTAWLSVKKGIFSIQNQNDVISPKNKRYIMCFANAFRITYEEALKIVSRDLSLLSKNVENLSGNIETSAKLLGISKREFLKAASSQPSLFYQKPETLNGNIETSAKLLGISKREFLKAASSQPSLFYQKPETLNKNIETSAKLLGISKEKFFKAVSKQPSLFCQKPETLDKNIETSAKLLGISKEEFLKVALKKPSLFHQKPETLDKNTETSAKKFGISKEEFIKVALRRPQLFYQKPETLDKNVETSAKLLGISKEKFLKAAMIQPSLFNQKPKTLDKNIETSAKLLGFSKEEFLKVALKQPPLFCQKPETLNKNIETSAKLFGISKEKFLKAALGRPKLFCLKSENLYKKLQIINYYQKIQNRKSVEKTVIHTESNKNLYKNILIYLLQSRLYPELIRKTIEKQLPELLKKIEGTVEFNIPPSDVAQEFIEFCQDYSQKILGRNIFKFVVQENKTMKN